MDAFVVAALWGTVSWTVDFNTEVCSVAELQINWPCT